MSNELRVVMFYLLVSALPVTAGTFRVWVHHESVELGYQLSDQEERRRQLGQAEREAEVALAAEKTPSQLMQVAARLGMVAPTPDSMVTESTLSQASGSSTTGSSETASRLATPRASERSGERDLSRVGLAAGHTGGRRGRP